MKMQTQAKLRYLRVSPRKVRLLINLIRGMNVVDALVQLEFSKKHAARPLMKLLRSGIANAKHNHQMKEETLTVAKAFVDGGPVIKRWMPRAFGRATPLKKRTSHITIVLEGEVDESKKKVKKSDTKNVEDKDVEKNEQEETKNKESKKF